MRWVLAAIWIVFVWAVPADAASKLALVIGNSDYQNVGVLKNPASDADLISTKLKSIGFNVTSKRDLGSTELRAAIIDFMTKVNQAGPGAIVLLYYAGHGVQIGSENYLVPVDARATSSITLEAFELSAYMANVPSSVAASIIILDACRNNPFASHSRGGSRGLTLVSDTGNAPTYIMFSAAPGKTAEDGTGDHSPFAEALAQNLGVPGVPIEVIGRRVRGVVFAATGEQQDPWANSDLKREVVLVPGSNAAGVSAPPPVAAPAPVPSAESPPATQPSDSVLELAYFDALRQNTFDAYDEVLKKYPNHPRKAEILAAIQRLADEQLWNNVNAHPSLGGYNQYIASFPEGTYIEVAKAKVEELSQGSDEDYCKSSTKLANARAGGRDALVEFRDRCSSISGGLAIEASLEIQNLDRANKEFKSYRGIDFNGDDLGPYLYNQSFESCADACRADTNCIAYTFNTLRSVCILKSGYGMPKFSNEAISAALQSLAVPSPQAGMRIERDMDHPGGDLGQNGIRPVALQECSQLCLGDSSCRGFSYVRAKRWCWLKSQVNSSFYKSGVTSGVKLELG